MRYRPQDLSHSKARNLMAKARADYEAGHTDALEKPFDEVCDKFSPVMHLVFLERFASPLRWHEARQKYAKSTAVSSMVGYIVGIGDPHTNNIMLDSSGELVRIDFGMTFDYGKLLSVPETVPCRLTREVVAGLGCMGACGIFRRSCETSLGVLREGSALVNAVIEVFVHDPIFSWTTVKAKRDPDSDGQAVPRELALAGALAEQEGNEMAKRAIAGVASKLAGEYSKGVDTALSVTAHVGWIIREATDRNNLCRLFYGWSPWL